MIMRFYGMSLNDTMDLTIRQAMILINEMQTILKMENGSPKKQGITLTPEMAKARFGRNK